MKRLIHLRHGQRLWNLENKFTGWTDVDLCDHGMMEARKAGRLLKSEGRYLDIFRDFKKRNRQIFFSTLEKILTLLVLFAIKLLMFTKDIRPAFLQI